MFNIVKLDRRMNGYGKFSHRIDSNGSWNTATIEFLKARTWLWDRAGPGVELKMLYKLQDRAFIWPTLDPHVHTIQWAWDTDNSQLRLYLNDDVLTQFLLVCERFNSNATI